VPRIAQRNLGGLVATFVAVGALLAPVAPASAGGAAVPPQSGGGGGTEYGAALGPGGRPVASRFGVTPARVVAGGVLPRIALRLDEAGVPRVRARIVLWPVGGGRVVKVDLGRVRTGALLRPVFPAGTELAPGRYAVRVHASDPAGRTLLRRGRTPGRSFLTVVAKPKPKPKPAPRPTPAPAPPPAPVAPVAPAGGTFPVAGAHTYGEGFGTDRGDHSHQGVDLLAAEGTPVVAPAAGTVRSTDYQPGGAGEYVVLHAAAGPDFFFAHCVRGSTKVAAGQAVAAGQPLCAVGTTGRSTAPHLHFELWPNGWRTGAKDSLPADPLALLKSWER
jgi:murein DD-endopeptidase MepM/ murein hydrolase activator NlpD